MANKSEDIENLKVSGNVLAKLFGMTSRRVRQLAEEGIIERLEKRKL